MFLGRGKALNNNRLLGGGLVLHLVGIVSIFCATLALASGCSNAEPTNEYAQFALKDGGLLEPGGYIIGPGDARVVASQNALRTPVEVKLREISPSTLETDPLPDSLRNLRDYLIVDANVGELQEAPTDGWFAVSFPIPPGVDEENLVVGFWMPSTTWPYWTARNSNDPSKEEGYWTILDGEVDSGRFSTTFYILPDEPLLVAFAEGKYFDAHDSEKQASTDDDVDSISSELNPFADVSIRVRCQKNDADVCTQAQRNRVALHLAEVMQDFASRNLGPYTFPEPRLRKWGSGFDYDYLIFLQMVQSKGVCVDGSGTGGRYNPLTGEIVLCIWPSDRAAPTIVVGPGVGPEGTEYTVDIDGKVAIATVTCTPDPSDPSVQQCDSADDIAQKLAEGIRSGTPPFLLHQNSLIESFGNKIAVYFRHDRSIVGTPVVDVSVSDPSGAIELEDFEYRILHVATHEYFHALQSGFSGGMLKNNWFYLEGTAVASERSTYQSPDSYWKLGNRDSRRDFRKLTYRNFHNGSWSEPDQKHYQAQDYFLFVSRILNLGIEWVLPMMEGHGDWSFHLLTLLLLDTSIAEVHWDYVRNMAIEKTFALDVNHLNNSYLDRQWMFGCELNQTLFADPDLERVVTYNGGVQTESMPVESFKAGYMKIEFPSGYHDRAYVIEATASNPNTRIAIYRNPFEYGPYEECALPIGGLHDRTKEITNVGFGTWADYAVVLTTAAFESDTVDVTIRPAETSISFHQEDGDIFIAGRGVTIAADYVVEQAPAEVAWYMFDQEFASETHSSRYRTVSQYLPPTETCPAGNKRLLVEVTGADSSYAFDEVVLDFQYAGTHLGIGVPGATCGGSHELRVTEPEIDPFSVTAFYRGCSTLSWHGWEWEVIAADGTSRAKTCSPGQDCRSLQMLDSDFRTGGSFGPATINLSHSGISGTTSNTIRPCNLAGSDGMPRCIDGATCDALNTRFDAINTDLIGLRDEARLALHFDHLIGQSFGNLVPDGLPHPGNRLLEDLEAFLDPDVLHVLQLIEDAYEKTDVSEFVASLSEARSATTRVRGESETIFFAGLFAVIYSHFHYFQDFNLGGEGGWYDFSVIDGWRTRTIDPIAASRHAYRYALHTWLDRFEKNEIISIAGGPVPLDDARTMERAFDVAVQGTWREMLNELNHE